MDTFGFINGVHYCFIVDEVGMASTFPKIKTQLAAQETHHVSVLYLSSSDQFVFKRELDLLEKLFSLQCMVIYETTSKNDLVEAAIETILNVNVMSEMNFIISGNEEFSKKIENQLHFLDIKRIQIQKQFFV